MFHSIGESRGKKEKRTRVKRKVKRRHNTVSYSGSNFLPVYTDRLELGGSEILTLSLFRNIKHVMGQSP